MLLNVTVAKKNPGEKLDFDFCIEADNSLLNNCHAKFKGEITVRGKYYYMGGDIYAEGKIDFCIDYPCDRCFKQVLHCTSVDFNEVFYREQPREEDYTYEGENVDITKAVNDCIILNQPSGVTCNDDCKGLCPVCGTDLNKKQCGCDEHLHISENPFSQLLKNKKN